MNQCELDAQMAQLIKKWQKLKQEFSEEELVDAVMKHRHYLLKCKALVVVKRLVSIVLLIALLYCLYMYTDMSFYLTAALRFVTVNTVFRVVHYKSFEMDCLVHNPLYDPYYVNEGDCSCSSFDSIPEIIDGNVSQSDIASDYIDKNIPLVIRQGAQSPDWWSEADRIGHLQNVTSLHNFFLSKKAFINSVACRLHTNIPLPHPNQKLLLRYLIDGIVPADDWFAIWEHCGKNQRRAFREAFGRPHFLADNIDIASSSFLILSQGCKDSKPIAIQEENQLAVICQMRGRLRFVLTPRESCENVCGRESYIVEISEGDCLIAPHLLYFIDVDLSSPPGLLNMAVLIPGSMGG